MARDEEIERRLNNWARWRLSLGCGATGYATVDLSRVGEGGQTYEGPTIPTWGPEAADTDKAILLLPAELKRTVEVVYLGAGSLPKKARQLCITERSVHGRIEQAHVLLRRHFAEKAEQARRERARVEALQRASVRQS
ncbi:MAG: hypothetical protein QM702_00045 [Rubrivivax sp.]